MIKPYNLDEFDITLKKDWLGKVKDDLKGKTLDTLNWKLGSKSYTPFYNQEDIDDLSLITPHPSSSWLNLQYVNIEDGFIDISKDALNNGADGLVIHSDGQDGWINNIKHILPQHCMLSLVSNTNCLEIYKDYLKHVMSLGINSQEVKGLGFWREIISVDVEQCSTNISYTKLQQLISDSELPHFRHLMIDISIITTQDIAPAMELGLSLSMMTSHINNLQQYGLSLKQIIANMFFRFHSKKRYFVEIAKLRALKGLLTALINQYDKSISAFPHIHIDINNTGEHALLSNTTEAMSSVLGGTDSVAVIPEVLTSQNIRIARNVSSIIKEESYFDKSEDVAKGSYFMESLTHDLAKEGWRIFSDLEKKGGFISAIESGYLKGLLVQNSEND